MKLQKRKKEQKHPDSKDKVKVNKFIQAEDSSRIKKLSENEIYIPLRK